MYNLVVLHQKIKDRFEPLVREHRGLFLLPNVKILTPCQFSPEIFWRFHFFSLPLPTLNKTTVFLSGGATVIA